MPQFSISTDGAAVDEGGTDSCDSHLVEDLAEDTEAEHVAILTPPRTGSCAPLDLDDDGSFSSFGAEAQSITGSIEVECLAAVQSDTRLDERENARLTDYAPADPLKLIQQYLLVVMSLGEYFLHELVGLFSW